MQLLKRFSLLRRIALAQERQATALEKIAESLKPPDVHVRTRPAEFGSLDLDYLNERFEKEQEAREQGVELDED